MLSILNRQQISPNTTNSYIKLPLRVESYRTNSQPVVVQCCVKIGSYFKEMLTEMNSRDESDKLQWKTNTAHV